MAKYDLYPEIKVNQYSGAWRGYPRIVEEIKKISGKRKQSLQLRVILVYIMKKSKRIWWTHCSRTGNFRG